VDPSFHDIFRYLKAILLHEHHMSVTMYSYIFQSNVFHSDTRLSQVLRSTTVVHGMVARFRSDHQNWDLGQVCQFPGGFCLLVTSVIACRVRVDGDRFQVRRRSEWWVICYRGDSDSVWACGIG